MLNSRIFSCFINIASENEVVALAFFTLEAFMYPGAYELEGEKVGH